MRLDPMPRIERCLIVEHPRSVPSPARLWRNADDRDRNIGIVLFRPGNRRILDRIGSKITGKLNAYFPFTALRRQQAGNLFAQRIVTTGVVDFLAFERLEIL